jgi:hypothetical protein
MKLQSLPTGMARSRPGPQENRRAIPLHLRGRFRAEWGNFSFGERGDDLELLLEHLRRCNHQEAAKLLDAVLAIDWRPSQ